MKKIQFIVLIVFTFQFCYSQSAEELTMQWKELFNKNDIKTAIPILRKAAEFGNGDAQYNLGYLLQNGIEIEKNPNEAIEWYKKSSENNFNDGHYAMMMAYGNGNGTEQNSEMAFNYAMKCANNNDATCMWNVVNCYITGNGVEKNEVKFQQWITKLAKLENPENLIQSGYITSARLELAHFYKNGEHFNKNLYQSYLWYLIYNEYKVDFSILKQDEAIKEIKELEKKLKPKETKNASADAGKLLGRKLNNLDQLYKNSL